MDAANRAERNEQQVKSFNELRTTKDQQILVVAFWKPSRCGLLGYIEVADLFEA